MLKGACMSLVGEPVQEPPVSCGKEEKGGLIRGGHGGWGRADGTCEGALRAEGLDDGLDLSGS